MAARPFGAERGCTESGSIHPCTAPHPASCPAATVPVAGLSVRLDARLSPIQNLSPGLASPSSELHRRLPVDQDV